MLGEPIEAALARTSTVSRKCHYVLQESVILRRKGFFALFVRTSNVQSETQQETVAASSLPRKTVLRPTPVRGISVPNGFPDSICRERRARRSDGTISEKCFLARSACSAARIRRPCRSTRPFRPIKTISKVAGREVNGAASLRCRELPAIATALVRQTRRCMRSDRTPPDCSPERRHSARSSFVTNSTVLSIPVPQREPGRRTVNVRRRRRRRRPRLFGAVTAALTPSSHIRVSDSGSQKQRLRADRSIVSRSATMTTKSTTTTTATTEAHYGNRPPETTPTTTRR